MTFPNSFARGGVAVAAQPLTRMVSNKTTVYTVVAADNGSVIRQTSGSNTFTLPASAGDRIGVGFSVTFINDYSAGGTMAIAVNGNDTIGASTQVAINLGNSVTLVCVAASLTAGRWQITHQGAIGSGAFVPVALGYAAQASGSASIAIGYSTVASAAASTAIGTTSGFAGSQAVTGAGAMALGGSYASGTDSFAAANADNTGTYGAQGANSVAIGYHAKATGANSVAISSDVGAVASGPGSCALLGGTATATYSLAVGPYATTGVRSKTVFGQNAFGVAGDTQWGAVILRASTTDATATVATSDGAAASTNNQVILTNNQAMTFNALITARENATGDTAAWNVSGCIKRGANAAATALVGTAVSLSTAADTGATTWTAVCAADTTNGGLKITVTGQAAKTIRWSATVYTNELAG
jgi:Head domain of trimeric autotransporter adhesin